jgi:hypothetical protein
LSNSVVKNIEGKIIIIGAVTESGIYEIGRLDPAAGYLWSVVNILLNHLHKPHWHKK